ncbi:MAG: hypothetical protein ABR528_11135 [Pseudonocardiaceae bacterium]
MRTGPQQPGQLSLPVAMADNVTAPRGVLVWLVGGPGAPGVGLTAVIARQFDPEVLRNYRLVLFSARGTGPGALVCWGTGPEGVGDALMRRGGERWGSGCGARRDGW